MSEQNILRKIEAFSENIERIEKLIRERFTQTFQNYVERSIDRLRREIKDGFASIVLLYHLIASSSCPFS